MNRLIPKEKLPPGPWIEDINNHQLDEYIFLFEDIECSVKRMGSWNWNGYVKLPEHYHNTNIDYLDIDDKIDVHGGITYNDGHKFGFDTCHAEDIAPGVEVLINQDPYLANLEKQLFGSIKKHYWTFESVKEETKNMAKQFHELYKKTKSS